MNGTGLKVLDCTLRDGGYYNDWDFESDLVDDYLGALSEARVECIELGLRQFSNRRYLGAHAYTTREYVKRLNLPAGPTYGVMIDAKTVLSSELCQRDAIDKLFLDAIDEEISLVRVAAHFREVEESKPMLQRLKEKGYVVGLNIMQASLQASDNIERLAAVIGDWRCLDVVYFADSLGSMNPTDVQRLYGAFRSSWLGDLGFHAHNNTGQAISNAMKAIELGCNWIDSTVTGMGRGAGNAETEYLLLESKIRRPIKELEPLFNLVSTRFGKMKRQYGWGASVPYYLGALKNIHPTYVQELCQDASLTPSLLPAILNDLGNTVTPHAFDKKILESVRSSVDLQDHSVAGSEVPKFLTGKEVLLVAQTESTTKYQQAIADYATKNKVTLMSINFPSRAPNLPYDYIVISHNEKYREDSSKYATAKCPFIAPKKLFSDSSIDVTYDYGFMVEKNTFCNKGSYSIIPSRLTLAYAIGFCLDAGCDDIKLVGFSGFEKHDPRQKEMEFLLTTLSQSGVSLQSLTRTSFSIEERSIYAI